MRTLVLLAAIISITIPSVASAVVSIEPAIIEHDLNSRPSGTITLSNVGDTEERYRLRSMHILMTEDGTPIEVPPHERSLADWIKFNPKELTIAPGTSRSVRYSIIPRQTDLEGEYWACIQLVPLVPMKAVTTDSSGLSTNIGIFAAVLVPVFGAVSPPEISADLKDLTATPVERGIRIASTIVNDGTGRFRASGQYEILDASGTPVLSGSLEAGTILPNSTRTYDAVCSEPLGEGEYTVRVEHTSDRSKEVLVGETELLIAADS